VLWSGVAPKEKMNGRTASAHLSRNVHLAKGPDSFNLIINQEKYQHNKKELKVNTGASSGFHPGS
jgi:hypothetical protein